MKIYLFLYPIREYVEDALTGTILKLFTEQEHDANRLNDIINARYRVRGYAVWWLLFSASKQNPLLPDYGRLSRQITIDEQDAFFACGISFLDNVIGKQYPDPDFILNQLPKKTTHLVLGGFHQWDCVDKLACAAHARGLPVIVDEDTTEQFFIYTCLQGKIPLKRPLSEHIQKVIQDCQDRDTLDQIIERRLNKPWFSPALEPAT